MINSTTEIHSQFSVYCNDQSLFGKFPKTRLQGMISDVITFSLWIIQVRSLSSWFFTVCNLDDRIANFLAEALLLQARRSEEEDFETFQDLVAKRTPFVPCKRQKIFVNPNFCSGTSREVLAGFLCGYFSRWWTIAFYLSDKRRAWVVHSIEHGVSDPIECSENVDWTTESIGPPEREAVKWWKRWCGDQNLDREVPAGGLMRPRDDRWRREDGGGAQVEELCKRRSAKRGGRGHRLAAGGGGVAQVPEGGRRGWPYRGFIVCVG